MGLYSLSRQGATGGIAVERMEKVKYEEDQEKKTLQKYKNRKKFCSYCKVLNSHKLNTRNSLIESSI